MHDVACCEYPKPQREHFIILYPCTKCRQGFTQRKEMAHFNRKPNITKRISSGQWDTTTQGRAHNIFFSRQVASDQENCITPRLHQSCKRLWLLPLPVFHETYHGSPYIIGGEVVYLQLGGKNAFSIKSPTGEFFLHFGQQ